MFVHMLGLWMVLFSIVLLPCILVAAVYQDGELVFFTDALAINLLAGLLLWQYGDPMTVQLRLRDGFVVVVALWVAASLQAAATLALGLGIAYTDAVFEAVSALTTTGATVLSGLDHMPKSVLFFRQELQWLGGIGVIVSAVALLPMLGIGGMQLMKAETPGPYKSEKLTPRIASTAAVLWKLYLAITIVCALAYWAAGMSLFDAVAHSFATVSTGGFSTYDASFAHFDSPLIEAVAIVFMLVGAINFGVHWLAWRSMSVETYRHNEEVRWFGWIVLFAVVIVTLVLWWSGDRDALGSSLRAAAFTVISVITSTGFGVDDFSTWASILPIFLILISFVGGCGGSTSGGMKVIRIMVVCRAMRQQLFLLTHPRSVRPIRVNGQVIDRRITDGVLGFICVHVVIVVVLTLVNRALGMDGVSAFSGVASSINNLGPALGAVSSSFASAPEASKWIFSAAMLLGRLEIFTVLVLFAPSFWRD
jgi:trk system potassium uptake protein TrkH